MKRTVWTVTCVVALCITVIVSSDAATGDDIKHDFEPAVTNQAGRDFPQVNSQGRIKFRVVAPKAKSVSTTFRDSTEFIKGDD
ncbi:MAG: hypothetical protein KDA92_22340, partial [Planctomycetales bacterium]|nr:hypothetical protein [Planctomycetales bacterium]